MKTEPAASSSIVTSIAEPIHKMSISGHSYHKTLLPMMGNELEMATEMVSDRDDCDVVI